MTALLLTLTKLKLWYARVQTFPWMAQKYYNCHDLAKYYNCNSCLARIFSHFVIWASLSTTFFNCVCWVVSSIQHVIAFPVKESAGLFRRYFETWSEKKGITHTKLIYCIKNPHCRCSSDQMEVTSYLKQLYNSRTCIKRYRIKRLPSIKGEVSWGFRYLLLKMLKKDPHLATK